MGLTVKQRGQSVATFRFVHVKLMETLAAWVPSTPEMEAKLLFGEHIWDLAQHADALGKRTHELRLPLQHSIAPALPYLNVLEQLATIEQTDRRISGFYDVVLPALGERLRSYLAETDTLMDAPTVRIVERILSEQSRMSAQGRELRRNLPNLSLKQPEWLEEFAGKEKSAGEMVVADNTVTAQMTS